MPQRLDEIEKRLALATDGPWVEEDARIWKIRPECFPEELCDTSLNGNSAADGDLIANAPDDLAYLLSVARAAERLLERRDDVGEGDRFDALRRALDGTSK